MLKLTYQYLRINFLFTVSFLCFTIYGFGQGDDIASVQNKINSFHKNNFQEKVYVHTDKSFYVTGDILWFKLYVIDAATNLPVDLSKVGYVEILDKENKPVSQIKIALTKGSGSGSALLPVSLNSGNYTLRAYTGFIKNYPPEFFFQKQITIINPLKNAGITTHDSATYTINFFPEGGDLVAGLSSKVGFKITDNFGKGVNGKGIIYNERGDTIIRFEPLKFGIGHFNFQPQENENYVAKVFFDDGFFLTKPLPKANKEGFRITLQNLNVSNEIHLNVQATNSLKNETVFLVAFSGTDSRVAQKATLHNGSAAFIIQKDRLAEGVNRLTLFNKAQQPVGERLYFKKPESKDPINIKSNAIEYSTRQKVSLSFSNENKISSDSTDMSLAVYRIDSLQQPDPATIKNYLLLTSDIKGIVESPDFYFSNDSMVEEVADNLMLTQGWRRFKVKNILEEKENKIQFPIEYKGQIISAKVSDPKTGMPVNKNVLAFLSIPDTKYKLFAGQSDSSGTVRFDVKDYYGPGEIILQADTSIERKYEITIQDPFSEKYTEQPSSIFSVSKQYNDLLEEYSISMQVANLYHPDSMQQFSLPPIKDSFPFYGEGLYTYKLDDYTRFATMEEVLREYVKPIYVTMKKGKLDMKIFNEDRKEFDDKNQLITVNGIPFTDRSQIFSFDPHKFKTIEVIPKNYYFGSVVFSGIANFITYQGNLENLEIDPSLVRVDYEGLQLQREFYAPEYETPQEVQSRIPDFRTTLFWAPQLSTNANGSVETTFYTSDRKGKYMVVLQGFCNGGLVNKHLFFEVK